MKIDPDRHQFAICCDSECGPKFGADISIAKSDYTTMKSWSDLGYSYSHPQYEHETYEAKTFLAGTEWFQLDEIEVFKKRE